MSFFNHPHVRWAYSGIALVLLASIVLIWKQQPTPSADPTLLITSTQSATIEPAIATQTEPTPTIEPKIAVDVIGAVQQTGVYYLAGTARVDDAVRAAGGLAPDADRDRINLAAHVADGEQIRVPRVGEAAAAGSAPGAGVSDAPIRGADQDGLIDINAADVATLDTLPGIGPVTADAIVAYRSANGPFTRIEDIENVKGIGPSLLVNIAPYITLGP